MCIQKRLELIFEKDFPENNFIIGVYIKLKMCNTYIKYSNTNEKCFIS